MDQKALQSEKLIGVEVSNSRLNAVSISEKDGILDNSSASLIKDEDLAPQLVKFISSLQIKFGDFDSIGITVPGLIDRETKRVTFSSQHPEYENIDFLGELEKVVKMNIYVENDANAAAYGEYLFGAGRGSKNLFYVTLGSGIGGAFIFDGKLWRGASGFAGEFGYIAVNSDGMRLEEVASSANIIRRTKTRFHQDPTSSLNEIGEESITISDVVREANNGDDFARLMLERTGTYVGMAIAGVINLLNIEKIIIGGEIMQAGKLVLEGIKNRAQESSFSPNYNSTEIVQGKLGENAAAAGVAMLAKNNFV
ncbi:MAG: ROK family protein [Pyrinomonadaceae bacterium]